MQHSTPQKRDPFRMLDQALSESWQPIDSLPLKGEGTFEVLTLSGLVRLARNRRDVRRIRPADGYGPARSSVGAVESGNYLTAIAWRWPRKAK